ncbi:hypothetical protein BJ944DRAFT_268794 [Cunninghamella echinulata]|nr:hypothetical protein BJ944DRAFT_268794 [Cunninghamella echinulata]
MTATPTIRAIDKASIHKICSAQVVYDLAAAMKELLENSIDAKATSIEIVFKENGLEGIEISDNGTGIDPSNYEYLALKQYTSKINTYSDLAKVNTFGFRGEALSSLCAFSHLSVITATSDQAPMGIRLEYDMHGHLKSKTPIARSVGTTVILTDLFHSYPVRLLEFKRNIKRDYNNALALIHAYALISTNIRIVAINQPSKGSRSRVIATNGNANLRDNITNVFGAKMVTQIMPFEIEIKEKTDLDTECHGKIVGFISKPQFGVGRRSADRQYFFINGRPCQLPKISKAFNELYRNFISNQYPCVIANFIIPTDSYDVNVTPDKRTILLHKEYLISDTIITGLAEQMEPSRSTFELNPLLSEKAETSIQTSSSSSSSSSSVSNANINYNRETRATITRQFDSFTHSAGKAFRPSTSRSSPSLSTSSNGSNSKRPATNNLLNYVKRSKPTTEKSIINLINSTDKTIKEEIRKEDDNNNKDNDIKELDELDSDITPTTNDGIESISTTAAVLDDSDNDNDNDIVNNIPKEKPSTLRGLWNTIDERISIQLTLSQLGKLTKNLSIDNENKENNNNNNNNKDDDDVDTNINSLSTSLKQASLNTDSNEIATEALNRVINKNDFSKIDVLGQFNNGFIIGLLDNDDIFIIDQHAADEKYNFETLQKSTRIKGQQLFKPQNLELTAPEELLVMDNVDIFRANGFDIKIDDQGEPTKRIFIISQPFSKNTMLDKKDISELVHLINERPGEMVRCSRIRGMFASRACRKSVMIGDSLSKSQMVKIIRNMGKIDQPWNCPHGRPTMRHLMTLKDLKHKAQNHRRQVTWKGSLLK